MVQVDVFWAYAIGAGFGAAAAHEPGGGTTAARRLLDDRRLTATVLFLGCVFVPSGVWLLWRFPSWETMHAATGPADLPGWLVAGFALTNVTQGVLGYAVTRALWRRGHRYAAWLQMPLGYLAMFFVLGYGWDGTGYRRFFSPDEAAWRIVALILITVFGLALGTAAAAAILLIVLGMALGTVTFAVLLVAILHPRGPAGALAQRFPDVIGQPGLRRDLERSY